MLHIHGGESSANTARQSTIPGEHFGWREALISGPAPSGVEGAEWRKLRARHLSDYYGVDLQKCEADLLGQEETLTTFSGHDEVVLWFEHDLFCQANMLYLLDWFAHHDLGKTRLSLICIGEFPGIEKFRGVGQLNADQLTSLLDTRHEVSATEKKLATAGWQAYCADDPREIEKLLQTDSPALPFLKDALQLHLERFPFVRNGLGRIENRALELIHSGLNEFIDLFSRFGDAESVYGLGDFQLWVTLRQMTDTNEPMITIRNGNHFGQELKSEQIRNSAFEITKAGEAVLKAEADFVELNGIDLWLGGVHLSGKTALWRWDEQNRKIAYL